MNATYEMRDIGMAAFSVFFMQSPSFLAHQRRLEHGHGRSNCASLFEITRIPSDNHIRDMLDAAEPERLHPVFVDAVAALEGMTGGLESFRRLGDHVLIALDGTEYFCSKTIHCQHCSTRLRGKDGKEYFHAMLGVALVAPGHDKVIPLEAEFIAPQDGAERTLPPSDGWPATGRATPGSIRSISAMTCSPASPSARPCARSAAISSSSASHLLIR
jgi:hypothetical protein